MNNFLFALGGVPYFYDLGLKKSGPCPESRVGQLWKLIVHYGMGNKLGLAKGGPYSGMVRFARVSDTGSPL